MTFCFKLEVLYEDNHLLAVNKPAGLPTMGAPGGHPSLFVAARQYIKVQYEKPGNVYLGVVSRLDALATGVVVFARTSKAAARLCRQFASGDTVKEYSCLVESVPQPTAGRCVNWLKHDDSLRRVLVVPAHSPHSKEAQLEYQTLRRCRRSTLVEVLLLTGRKHQIRVQMAQLGCPILGDAKYGSKFPFAEGIALHARRLSFTHPVQHTPMTIEAPLPPSWQAETGG